MHSRAHSGVSPAALAGTGAIFLLIALAGGCTTFDGWVRNGFKVGPNFQKPEASVASDWLNADFPVVRKEADGGDWWRVFNDQALSSLVETAYRQNLDLKTAATRVLQAQAQRNITAGNLFPQTQNAIGDYAHAQIPTSTLGGGATPAGFPSLSLPSNLSVWATGFNASWEIDFWGRLRRNVESSNATLDASVDAYHDALVTLVSDVATNYVQLRTFQRRIDYARRNVDTQKGSLRLAEIRLNEGKATALDVQQARSNLAQTESTIPPLVIGLKQANDRLCVLLGSAPENLAVCLKEGPVPAAPPEVAVGIPAELLERRPDVRRALREVGAQC